MMKILTSVSTHIHNDKQTTLGNDYKTLKHSSRKQKQNNNSEYCCGNNENAIAVEL